MELIMNKATIPVITIVIGLFLFALSLPPIAQDLGYHEFADQSRLLGIPHALNVLSNLPYLLVAVLAWRSFALQRFPPMSSYRRGLLMTFFVSTGLLAFGSSIYHLYPDNTGLLLDRLCMALAFGSYLLVLLADYQSEKISAMLAPAVLLFALGSVVYWYVGEQNGQGDLRFYVIVQLLPVLLTPTLAGLSERQNSVRRRYWLITLCYLLAKGFEYYDVEVFNFLGLISGHSSKHLVSAFAVYLFYCIQINRERMIIERALTTNYQNRYIK
jgi:hypothetical protein